jgi:hypothetical protein
LAPIKSHNPRARFPSKILLFPLSPSFFMQQRRRPSMASLPAAAPSHFPSPLSPCHYLRLSPSSRSPLCTRITSSRIRAPHTPIATAPFSAAAGGACRR